SNAGLFAGLAHRGFCRRFVVFAAARKALPHAAVGAAEDRVLEAANVVSPKRDDQNLKRCTAHRSAPTCRARQQHTRPDCSDGLPGRRLSTKMPSPMQQRWTDRVPELPGQLTTLRE